MIRPVAWNALALVASAAAPAAIMIALTRQLSPADVGTYGVITWSATFAATLAAGGAPLALTRYSAAHRHTPGFAAALLRAVLARLLPWGLLVAGVAAAVCAWMAPQARLGAACAALGALPLAWSLQAQAAYRGEQRFTALAIRQVVVSLAAIVLTLAVLMTHRSATAVLGAFAAQSVIAAWVFAHGVRWRGGTPLDAAVWTRFRTLTGSLLVLAVIDQIIWQRSEVIALRAFRPAEEVAFYALPYSLVAALALVPAAVSGVLLPRLAGAAPSPDRARQSYPAAMRALAFTALPLAACAFVLAPALLQVVSGGAYAASVPVFRILCATSALAAIAAAGSAVLITEEDTGIMLRSGLIAAGVSLVGDLVLIPRFGARGAACANGLAQCTAVALTLRHLLRVHRVTLPWASLARLSVVAAGAAGVAALVQSRLLPGTLAGLCGAAVAAVAIYLGACTLAGEWPLRPVAGD